MENEIIPTLLGAMTLASIFYICFCIYCAGCAIHNNFEDLQLIKENSKTVYYSIYIGGAITVFSLCVFIALLSNGFAHHILRL